MAVTIKLKNASGSDPSASDLVVGEVAIRTDLGKLFTKKDNGSVAEISGGGIDDGDKGDITVSNSGATFTIDNDAVTYAKIQNVSATNRILGRDSSGAGVIEEITPANLRTMINVENGATADQSASEIVALIADQTIAPSTIDMEDNEEIRLGNSDDLKIFHNGSHSRFLDNGAGKLQFGSDTGFEILTANFATQIALFDTTQILLKENTSVTGNITVSGTVDGRDVASDGSKLDGIESGATADQSNSEIKTAYEANSNTNAFTDALLSKLNGIAASATNVTNNNQLTNGAGYITATLTNEQVQDIVGGMVSGNTESGITVTYQDGDGTLDFSVASQTDNNFTNADHSKLDGIEAGATADQTASEILTLLKTVDGLGSGLDADLLDGLTSSEFVRSNAFDTIQDQISMSKDTSDVLDFSANSTNDSRGISFNSRTALSADYNDGYLRLNQGNEFSNGIYTPGVFRADGGFNVDGSTVINGSGNIVASKVPTLNQNTTGTSGGFTAGNASNLNSGTIPDARFPATLPAVSGANLTGISAGATGGGSDEIFFENGQNVTTNYTITNGKNAMTAGPITINSGVTVIVGSGETLTIV